MSFDFKLRFDHFETKLWRLLKQLFFFFNQPINWSRKTSCSALFHPFAVIAGKGDSPLWKPRTRHSREFMFQQTPTIASEKCEIISCNLRAILHFFSFLHTMLSPRLLPSQTVSYTQFLYPTNVLGGRRNTIDSTSSFSQSRNASHRSLSLGRANSNQSSLDTGQSSWSRRVIGPPLHLPLKCIYFFTLFPVRLKSYPPLTFVTTHGDNFVFSWLHPRFSPVQCFFFFYLLLSLPLFLWPNPKLAPIPSPYPLPLRLQEVQRVNGGGNDMQMSVPSFCFVQFC